MIAPERIQALIDHYADGPRLLEAAIAGIGPEEMHFIPGPEHWSIHENVIHVVDCDLLTSVRIRYILTQPGTALVGFDQGAWARVFRYAERSVVDYHLRTIAKRRRQFADRQA